jgi:hypothetical protein
MARTLITDFGGQMEPCLLLPRLLSQDSRSALVTVLSKLFAAVTQQGETFHLILHGLSLPNALICCGISSVCVRSYAAMSFAQI